MNEVQRHVPGPRRVRFIQERKNRQLTQKQLANELGTSLSTISLLETGRMNPGVELTMRIQEYFGLDYYEIFPDN